MKKKEETKRHQRWREKDGAMMQEMKKEPIWKQVQEHAGGEEKEKRESNIGQKKKIAKQNFKRFPHIVFFGGDFPPGLVIFHQLCRSGFQRPCVPRNLQDIQELRHHIGGEAGKLGYGAQGIRIMAFVVLEVIDLVWELLEEAENKQQIVHETGTCRMFFVFVFRKVFLNKYTWNVL